MKKPFKDTKFGKVLKIALDTAVDIIPAGESVKKIINNVAGKEVNASKNSTELLKIVKAVILAGLVVGIALGKIDIVSISSILDALTGI